MTQHDDLLYLGHMLDTAKRAVAKVKGVTRNEFDADENLRLALVHLIQVIGEAARHVSDGVKDAHPEIAWSKIIGTRHRVVHDYTNVDEDVVWDVASIHLSVLIQQLRAFVPEDPPT